MAATPPLIHDLSHPDYDPPDTPAWTREDVPPCYRQFMGKNGLGSPWQDRPGPLAPKVAGLDRYQANHFIVSRPETTYYLYSHYTLRPMVLPPGALPACEALAAETTAGCATKADKAVALLLKAMPRVKHPTVPPCSPSVPPGRNLDDDALLRSGAAWCNEQARVFIRLCQACGIPARIIHLFYSDQKTGHTIAEFLAEGGWAMADASWLCAFPGADGKLLSAARCHDRAEGQAACGRAYYRRQQELLRLSDAELSLPAGTDRAEWRRTFAAQTADDLARKMDKFAVINHPLPV